MGKRLKLFRNGFVGLCSFRARQLYRYQLRRKQLQLNLKLFVLFPGNNMSFAWLNRPCLFLWCSHLLPANTPPTIKEPFTSFSPETEVIAFLSFPPLYISQNPFEARFSSTTDSPAKNAISGSVWQLSYRQSQPGWQGCHTPTLHTQQENGPMYRPPTITKRQNCSNRIEIRMMVSVGRQHGISLLFKFFSPSPPKTVQRVWGKAPGFSCPNLSLGFSF